MSFSKEVARAMFDEGKRSLIRISLARMFQSSKSAILQGVMGLVICRKLTYSEVEARKNGDVSRNALVVAAPKASSPKQRRFMVSN